MEIKRGKASNVVHTKEVVPIEGGHIVTFIVLFRMNGQKIKFASDKSPRIREGDDLCVAGNSDAGVFSACAYKNFTNGATGEEFTGVGTPAVLFGVLIVTAVAAVTCVLLPVAGVVAAALSLLFIGELLFILYRLLQTSKASKLLRLQRKRSVE